MKSIQIKTENLGTIDKPKFVKHKVPLDTNKDVLLLTKIRTLAEFTGDEDANRPEERESYYYHQCKNGEKYFYNYKRIDDSRKKVPDEHIYNVGIDTVVTEMTEHPKRWTTITNEALEIIEELPEL